MLITILALAWPTMLEQLMQTAVQYIDTAMVGTLGTQAVLVTCVLGIFFTVLTVSLSGVIPVWMQVEPGIQKMASAYFLILYLPMLPRTASIILGTVQAESVLPLCSGNIPWSRLMGRSFPRICRF